MEESEEEEDRLWGERISRWLDGVVTGEEACQQVLDNVVTSQSPEFQKANAIIVVYGED